MGVREEGRERGKEEERSGGGMIRGQNKRKGTRSSRKETRYWIWKVWREGEMEEKEKEAKVKEYREMKKE